MGQPAVRLVGLLDENVPGTFARQAYPGPGDRRPSWSTTSTSRRVAGSAISISPGLLGRKRTSRSASRAEIRGLLASTSTSQRPPRAGRHRIGPRHRSRPGSASSSPGDVFPGLFVGGFLILFAGTWILLGTAMAVCLFLAGRYLSEPSHYTFCLVTAGVACTFMPLGTVLGVFSLLVLLRPSVRARFEGPRPPGAHPTTPGMPA